MVSLATATLVYRYAILHHWTRDRQAVVYWVWRLRRELARTLSATRVWLWDSLGLTQWYWLRLRLKWRHQAEAG